MEYFCAAISGKGFYNGFAEVFNERTLKRLYVIKGASGVGKSTLMRRIAEEGESRGFPIDRIYCSSDPRSLDGVIVGDIGVIDGTPPHSYEPKMAGAFETLVDLGGFWDKTKLERDRDRISMLVENKKTRFERIYELMSIYGQISDLITKEREQHYDKAAIDTYTRSLVKRRLGNGALGEAKRRIFTASLGATLLPKCEKCYTVEEKLGFAPMFMRSLADELRKSGVEFFFSPELPSLEKIGTIYIPSCSIVYTTCEGGRNIKGKRFLKNVEYRSIRTSPSELSESLDAISKQIDHERSSAMKLHYEIEKIYISAMDFKRLGEYTDMLLNEIFA